MTNARPEEAGVPATGEAGPDRRISVVVVTMNRRDELLTTLGHLCSLPERPDVVVVDNGSTDGTTASVRSSFPGVRVLEMGRNIGSPARNVGVRAVHTPYVAFADDDSWWAPGSLRRAADHLDAHPRLAVLQGRILVGPEERPDPICAVMANSPLAAEADLPGPSILGFIACGAVVRREPFLEAGGFDDLIFFYGEEALLSQDLSTLGWGLTYVDDVVAHHHPSPVRDHAGRRRRQQRNDLLTVWMRRAPAIALSRTARLVARAVRDAAARGAAVDAVRLLPAALRRRRRLPRPVEAQVSLLD